MTRSISCCERAVHVSARRADVTLTPLHYLQLQAVPSQVWYGYDEAEQIVRVCFQTRYV